MKRRDVALVTALSTLTGLTWLRLVADRPMAGGWAGVDELVVAGTARAAGHAPTPWIGWVEGDALLFAFLSAGLIAGFCLGYCARALREPEISS